MDSNAPVTILGPDEPDPIGSNESANRNPEPIRTPESGTGTSGIPTIDPFSVSGTDIGTGPVPINAGRRGRGRPPGSKNKSTAEKAPPSGDLKVSIEDLLISCHEMIATFVGAEELELDAEEAKQGAHHIKEISKLYNHTFNPATLVWMGFVMWILAVYGTRGVAIYKRVTTAEKKATPPKVINMPPVRDTSAAKPQAVPSENKITNPSQLWDEAPITHYE